MKGKASAPAVLQALVQIWQPAGIVLLPDKGVLTLCERSYARGKLGNLSRPEACALVAEPIRELPAMHDRDALRAVRRTYLRSGGGGRPEERSIIVVRELLLD